MCVSINATSEANDFMTKLLERRYDLYRTLDL